MLAYFFLIVRSNGHPLLAGVLLLNLHLMEHLLILTYFLLKHLFVSLDRGQFVLHSTQTDLGLLLLSHLLRLAFLKWLWQRLAYPLCHSARRSAGRSSARQISRSGCGPCAQGGTR